MDGLGPANLHRTHRLTHTKPKQPHLCIACTAFAFSRVCFAWAGGSTCVCRLFRIRQRRGRHQPVVATPTPAPVPWRRSGVIGCLTCVRNHTTGVAYALLVVAGPTRTGSWMHKLLLAFTETSLFSRARLSFYLWLFHVKHFSRKIVFRYKVKKPKLFR